MFTANDAREMAYEMRDEETRHLPADAPQPPLTAELLERVVTALNHASYADGKARLKAAKERGEVGPAPRGTRYATEQVEGWLRDPSWSPYVDEVAVTRAIDFDWDVISSLTRAERAELTRRLAEMANPYDLDADAEISALLHRGLSYTPSRTTRRLRWEAGEKSARRAIQNDVKNYLNRLAGAELASTELVAA